MKEELTKFWKKSEVKGFFEESRSAKTEEELRSFIKEKVNMMFFYQSKSHQIRYELIVFGLFSLVYFMRKRELSKINLNLKKKLVQFEFRGVFSKTKKVDVPLKNLDVKFEYKQFENGAIQPRYVIERNDGGRFFLERATLNRMKRFFRLGRGWNF